MHLWIKSSNVASMVFLKDILKNQMIPSLSVKDMVFQNVLLQIIPGSATIQLTKLALTLVQVALSIDDADAIYTLQGQKMPAGATPQKGMYLVRKGNVTQKLQVR